MIEQNTSCIIEKETISQIKFPKEDVLQDKGKKKRLIYFPFYSHNPPYLNKTHGYFRKNLSH